MTVKNKDKKNFIWNAIGLTFNSFNSLFFLIIVKLINGIDVAGVFIYAFSLCCFFFVFSAYYNRTFQVSDIKNKFSFSDYLTCRVVLSILSLVLIIIFSLISQFTFYKIIVIILIMCFRNIEAISDCFYGEIQRHDELYKTGISLTVKSIGGTLLFLLSDLTTHSLLLSISALIVINLILFIFYDLRAYHKISKSLIRFDVKNISKILKSCFPVFLFTALAIYLANCQKYILTYYGSNEIQTIFGILVMPATMISLIGSYLVNPFVNGLNNLHLQKNYKRFTNMILKIMCGLLLCGFVGLVLCWFIGIPILNFIYQMTLDTYKIQLMLVIVASIFYALVLLMSGFLTVLKENRRQPILYIIAATIATITSFIMIPTQGISGAVFSFLAAGIVLAFLYAILLFAKINKLAKNAHKGRSNE